MLSWIENASQLDDKSDRQGAGDLAEGEPFRLLFRFRRGPNCGGSKFGMTEQLKAVDRLHLMY